MMERHALGRYISEAHRDPFELLADDEQTLVFDVPPIGALLAASEKCTLDGLIRLLTGARYGDFLSVLGAEKGSVLRAVLRDMAEHFRLPDVARVADLIDRYGSAIRADLGRFYPGVDMLDFFRGRLSAQAILDYLEHLPRTSAYHTAIADDEELAAELVKLPEQKPSPPRLAEFSPELQALAEIRDLIATLINVQVARAGKKPSKVKPYPRPVSAIERIRRRQKYLTHRSLVDRLTARNE
jgi:hypothetical protein